MADFNQVANKRFYITPLVVVATHLFRENPNGDELMQLAAALGLLEVPTQLPDGRYGCYRFAVPEVHADAMDNVMHRGRGPYPGEERDHLRQMTNAARRMGVRMGAGLDVLEDSGFYAKFVEQGMNVFALARAVMFCGENMAMVDLIKTAHRSTVLDAKLPKVPWEVYQLTGFKDCDFIGRYRHDFDYGNGKCYFAILDPTDHRHMSKLWPRKAELGERYNPWARVKAVGPRKWHVVTTGVSDVRGETSVQVRDLHDDDMIGGHEGVWSTNSNALADYTAAHTAVEGYSQLSTGPQAVYVGLTDKWLAPRVIAATQADVMESYAGEGIRVSPLPLMMHTSRVYGGVRLTPITVISTISSSEATIRMKLPAHIKGAAFWIMPGELEGINGQVVGERPVFITSVGGDLVVNMVVKRPFPHQVYLLDYSGPVELNQIEFFDYARYTLHANALIKSLL
jgi:hypothetical protein